MATVVVTQEKPSTPPASAPAPRANTPPAQQPAPVPMKAELPKASKSQTKELFTAVMREDIDKLRQMVQAGVSLHVENSKGQSLVQIATERDKPIALQFLTEELLREADRAQALLDKRP